MASNYSENTMVQQAAANLLREELGWQVAMAYRAERVGIDRSTWGRRSYREVVLRNPLREALLRLNPWIGDEQVAEAIRMLESHLASSSPLQINEEKYAMLRDGIYLSVRMPDGSPGKRLVRFLDFNDVAQNRFLALQEFIVQGDVYERRADMVGFVNGIPLLFIELKRNTEDVANAYNGNYRDYCDTVPQLFHYNAMVMLSNGVASKVGALGSSYEFFHEWKRLRETDKGCVNLKTMLRGMCQRDNFLDLLENFILFDHSGEKVVKILARNHQYLGVNNAVQSYAHRHENGGKLGVFWHTQGSGKSYSMVFLAQKIRRKFEGTPTIVVLTDRDELNRQISDTFEGCGLLGRGMGERSQATSGEDLCAKLQGNPGFVFTLIQKFNRREGQPILPLHDVLIISDEAHRSQYGELAENMCRLLPTASRIGFTGTPLLSSDEITKRTFGGYVSIYDFQRAVEDGATVPLYYENRGHQIGLEDTTELNERIEAAIEAADLAPDQQERLEREFEKEIHILTAEPRLRRIAQDFVQHYSDLWTSGKAMFVCLNKVTCVRMFNYVQEYWLQEVERLEIRTQWLPEGDALRRKLRWMKETEMAVIISEEQNEEASFTAWGLDVAPHRRKMKQREMDKEFKQKDNPFRVAFVCAMWLTGFDVKSLSCLYLDKALRAHTLMQAIARANRVAEGKGNGLIVDYIGIVGSLKKALADYTNTEGGGSRPPAVDKSELLEKIAELVETIKAFLSRLGFELRALVDCPVGHFDRLERLQEASNAVSTNFRTRKAFIAYAHDLARMVKYANRDDLSDSLRAEKDAILAIEHNLRPKRRKVNYTELQVALHDILSDYVSAEAPLEAGEKVDLSAIDFHRLACEFEAARRIHLVIRDLAELVEQQMERILSVANPRRVDYLERYRAIIEAYNAQQDKNNIERVFEELMRLAQELGEEQQRYAREGFDNAEQLAVYDLLFKEELTKEEVRAIKALSIELLAAIRSKIASFDRWTEKEGTRAAVSVCIRDFLYKLPAEDYPDECLEDYSSKLFNYFYVRYKDADMSEPA